MDNKTIALALGAVALYMVLSKRNNTAPAQQQQQQFRPQYSYVPPQPPPNNAQAWSQWVNAIVGAYGTAASLWQPGGPFYQAPITPNQAQNIATNFANGMGYAFP